jgi:L-threonylcarbamoyladenylate synthase
MSMNAPRITTSIAEAVDALRDGQVVAIPTETVYGLAADATNEAALGQIYELKGRPRHHPLIVHFASMDLAWESGREISDVARRLARRFWPGPLTLIVRKQPWIPPIITANQDSLALRVPSHPVAQELLQNFPRGLAAPSANRFTKVSPTTARHVAQDLAGRLGLILDGGACEIGIESTILDCTQVPPVLLRPGYVTVEELEDLLGTRLMFRNAAGTLSPGQHAVHYAPDADVYLATQENLEQQISLVSREASGVLVIAPEAPLVASPITWWAIPADHAEFAKRIYGYLREADGAGFKTVVIATPNEQGIGRAIIDRLVKAAKPFNPN